MDIDFALVLVVLTSVSGFIWLVDSLLFRRKRLERQEKKNADLPVEPILVEYSRSLFPVLLIVLLFRSFLFEPFKIPSGSMIPTLLVGDFIVVNKFTYGIRLPVLNKKILSLNLPERGDVVVFRHPAEAGINLIKRTIGLPGDTITYRNKQLYVNGEQVLKENIGPFRSTDIKCSTPARDAVLITEQLGNVDHPVLSHTQQNVADGQWVVPEGHYFMMGDNRDRSRDSRSWGFAPEENLMGKAVGIWLNFDFEKGCADWSRIGTGIH